MRVAGFYNIAAGVAMVVFYHEGFKALGLEKPDLVLPIQLVGVLVAIFGVGYLLAARNPYENRNIVLLGFLSKLLGPILATYYIAAGKLPISMVPVLLLADIVYLVPFWLIWKKTETKQEQLEVEPPSTRRFGDDKLKRNRAA